MKINWKELFEINNTVFHCETQEHAIELLKIAHNHGYKWNCGDSFLTYNYWNDYNKNTCYEISSIDGGSYGPLSYYQINCYNIINVNELLYDRKPFKLHRQQ